MLSWHKLVFPLLTLAALYWYPLRGMRLEQDLAISAGLIYAAVSFLFIFWLLALLNFLRIRGEQIMRAHQFAGALIAAGICFCLILWRVPGDFRVQTDEAILATTAERMYREQKNYAVFEVLRFTDTEQVLSQNIDKRPPLFSFLVHLLHHLRGYSLQHSLLLNLLLLPVFSVLCFYLVPLNWGFGARVAAVFFASLFLPVVVASRSGGADFLALVLLAMSLLLTRHYFQDRRRELMILWICTLAIFSITRMESLFAALLLLAAGIISSSAKDKLRTYLILMLMPLLTICLWPVLQFLEPRWHIGEYEIRGSLLAFDNLPKNMQSLGKGFASSHHGYPDLLWLGILLFLATFLAIVDCIKWSKHDVSKKYLPIFYWVCWGLAPLLGLFIVVWMPFGAFTNPGALRLYAPFGLVLAFLMAYLLFCSSRIDKAKYFVAFLLALALGRAFLTLDVERSFVDYGAFHQDRAVRKFLTAHQQPTTLVIAKESVQAQVMGVSAIDFVTARNNRERIARAINSGAMQKIFIVQSLDRNLLPLPDQSLDWPKKTLLEQTVSERTVLRISQPSILPE